MSERVFLVEKLSLSQSILFHCTYMAQTDHELPLIQRLVGCHDSLYVYRSCGQVFCGVCSDYFCQVPHEQLFEAVRVCEKCFYKLDGHLQQKSAQGAPPV